MHDIKFIRNNPELFKTAMQTRGVSGSDIDEIIRLDEQKRDAITKIQQLQRARNELNSYAKIAFGVGSGIAEVKASPALSDVGCTAGSYTADQLKETSSDLSKKIRTLEQISDNDLQAMLANLPNFPAEDVPEGYDENDNIEQYRWPETQDNKHEILRKNAIPHYEICGSLIDFEQTAQISGSRFSTLKGDLASLERALCNFMLDKHIKSNEYRCNYISPPLLVKDSAMYGVGQLPKFAEDSYSTEDNMRLIPTAEAFLTNLVADKILEYDSLPLRFVACTPCFRREAGSAGRDTRGLIRQHQFTKVELVSVVAQEDSFDELEALTRAAESILEALELPYRRVLLCSKDMGFAASKTYDLEVWMPSQNCYREISSCSNCLDFQTRRMKARYRLDDEIYFAHTLNGSALAVGRTIAAILENYQNENNTVTVPKSIVPYMDNKKEINLV